MARLAMSGTDGGAPLLLLLALLPFEPREPTLSVPGMQLTLLEIAALLLVPWIAWSNRRELPRLVRRPPLPLVFLGAFASCHLLSAVLAETPRFLPLKASLRMLACAGFAFVVAALGRERQRRALRGLAWGTLCVALLAVIEGSGFGGLDALLDAFREGAIFVGGTRRASAGSEHPNLAAAFLASGLVIWSGLAFSRGRSLLAVAVLTLGLLSTYSRGGLVAALISLCALLVARAIAGLSLRTVVGTLSLLGLASIAFALTSEAFRLRLLGEPAAGWFVARYRLETEGLQLAPGESVPLAVELENQGKASWRAAHGMALGQRWFDLGTDELRGGLATTLPSDVEPGHRLKLVVPLTAPGVPGRYRVLLDLTHDNRRWLSEAGIAPGSVDVLVGTTQEADVPPSSAGSPQAVLPSYRQPDRAEYSGWALAMWRERPWTGVGSGNFRWLHRRYAGRHVDSVSAGSAFLELGATTGWLGVLTFCGTLAACFASLIAALRGLRPNLDEAGWPPLLLGLLVAVVVHGCVDYFLAATGHYLFFGFLVASTAVAGGRPAPGDAAASGSGRS